MCPRPQSSWRIVYYISSPWHKMIWFKYVLLMAGLGWRRLRKSYQKAFIRDLLSLRTEGRKCALDLPLIDRYLCVCIYIKATKLLYKSYFMHLRFNLLLEAMFKFPMNSIGSDEAKQYIVCQHITCFIHYCFIIGIITELHDSSN